ncbi:PRA1 family protein 3 [Armadillidium vulgare]|nr:PRA1 family protein 3 [Armadillidium vulgare]
MFFGMVAIGLGFGIFFYLTNNKQVANDFKKSHPVVSVIFVLSSSYFVVYLLGSVVVFIFGILLPIFVILIHASMRLRNMKNKIMNKVEWIGLRRSPMGIFLDFLGMEQEFVMDCIFLFLSAIDIVRSSNYVKYNLFCVSSRNVTPWIFNLFHFSSIMELNLLKGISLNFN